MCTCVLLCVWPRKSAQIEVRVCVCVCVAVQLLYTTSLSVCEAGSGQAGCCEGRCGPKSHAWCQDRRFHDSKKERQGHPCACATAQALRANEYKGC